MNCSCSLQWQHIFIDPLSSYQLNKSELIYMPWYISPNQLKICIKENRKSNVVPIQTQRIFLPWFIVRIDLQDQTNESISDKWANRGPRKFVNILLNNTHTTVTTDQVARQKLSAISKIKNFTPKNPITQTYAHCIVADKLVKYTNQTVDFRWLECNHIRLAAGNARFGQFDVENFAATICNLFIFTVNIDPCWRFNNQFV